MTKESGKEGTLKGFSDFALLFVEQALFSFQALPVQILPPHTNIPTQHFDSHQREPNSQREKTEKLECREEEGERNKRKGEAVAKGGKEKGFYKGLERVHRTIQGAAGLVRGEKKNLSRILFLRKSYFLFK